MSNVERFKRARELAAEREYNELQRTALRLIEELGNEAGYMTGLVASLRELAPAAKTRLLMVVAEIERQQGYGWYFPDSEGGVELSARS